jgi:hypothetical protein
VLGAMLNIAVREWGWLRANNPVQVLTLSG